MRPEIYTAAQGMVARQLELDMVANNIANASTTGFREVSPFFRSFNEALLDGPRNPLNNAANNQPVAAGVFLHDQAGSVKHTGQPLDLALDGQGFFKVATPDGPRYTRNGHFTLAPLDRFTGKLVTDRGYDVLDVNGAPVTLDLNADDVVIDGSGVVSQDGVARGRLAIVDFDVDQGLTPEEDTLIAMLDPAAQEIPAQGRVRAGFLETSNVNIAQQMIRMIAAQRAYEMSARTLRNIDTGLNQAAIRAFAPR